MAPEVVEAFMDDTERDLVYDKRCDLWSLGKTLTLFCGKSEIRYSTFDRHFIIVIFDVIDNFSEDFL